MEIIRYSLGQLQTNCYVLHNYSNCVLIDPGDSADFLLEEISRKRLELQLIISTHGHFDHVMAVGEIQMSYSVPLLLSSDDMFLIKRLQSTVSHFLGKSWNVISPFTIQEPQQKLELLDTEFEIIKTPGHTPGSFCIYVPSENALFTGDTLCKDVIADTSHTYSSKKDLAKSLHALFELPDEVMVYPGHGETMFLGDEKSKYLRV